MHDALEHSLEGSSILRERCSEGIVVTNHYLTGIVVVVTPRTARGSRGYDPGLKRRGGQGTLMSSGNPARFAGFQCVVDADAIPPVSLCARPL